MSTNRIDDIEVLRALAVLFVIVHHTFGNLIMWRHSVSPFIPYFNGGAGVDLFFAISGFVIAKDFIGRMDARQGLSAKFEEAVSFWIKRIWRLIPSAWLWLALILALSFFYNSSGVFEPFEANLWATLAGALNFANFRLADSFGNYSYGASFVYWSLSLEEQFYLLFPLFLIFLRRWFVYLVLALLFFQLFSERSANIVMMMFRTDALMLGILLAMLSNSKWHKKCEPSYFTNRLPGIVLVAGCLLALLMVGSVAMNELPYRMSMVALLAGLLVYLASYDKSYVMKDSSLKQLMVTLGARSYALYLSHIPAFFLVRESWVRIVGLDTPEGFAARVLFIVLAYTLVFGLAELNYRFVETPFRRVGQQIAARRAARAVADSHLERV
ncbi:MAG: acyltransferase family protein [Pseudomonadales bacterium]